MASDRFVSPCPLPTPVESEILTTLIEEAAEVIQRATKLQRFGRDEIQPGQPLTNAERLAGEIGDLMGMVQIAIEAGLVPQMPIEVGREVKIERFEKYRQHRPVTDPTEGAGMLSEIKHCPFCGNAPEVDRCEPWPKNAGPQPWYAGCYHGGDGEHFIGVNGDTRDDAIRQWNAIAFRPTPVTTEGGGENG